MNKEINFRDDLFFLYRQIKLIRLLRNLRIDQRLYEEKIISDVQFIEQRIIQFYQLLTEGNILLERLEHLQLLSFVTRTFLSLLEKKEESADKLSEMLLPHTSIVTSIRINVENVITQVQDVLEKSINAGEKENFVSETELEMLLKDPPAHE